MADTLVCAGPTVSFPTLRECRRPCRQTRAPQALLSIAPPCGRRGECHQRLSVCLPGVAQRTLRQSTFLTDVRWKAQVLQQAAPRLRQCQGGATRAIFTGIVEEMGTVRELKQVDGGWELTVEASTVLEDVKLGDSIAVNGTCLTVTRFDPTYFAVGLAPETLRKTSLEELETGSKVNLERSLQPSGRMGGHFVQGHVDGTGVISKFEPDGDSLVVTIKTTPEMLRYIVKKGYIAVDGTSLTVVEVLDAELSFTFMLVAYTQQKIVVPLKKVGDKVNLEVDIVGKYVERMTEGYRQVG
ncbi:riboflavin synthase [Klebsormidium nitens]|uniref:Riboflavin synthase n=1 Tax=Klebsormidium nitens TaxID=105231 RepID=A0A1Y1I3X9_KLENI|nr:riboflavin synthase [Klebsormidium nitens]|eukprot:GAQ82808.1 riboflavin synthase [Klebsormidium nitens]